MNPEERSWIVQEKYFQPQQQHYYETILTIGNGYLGTRASFEEGYPNELPSTLVHGVFNHHEEDLVPDLANVPAWYTVEIVVEGHTFDLTQGTILGYDRQLDMRTGVLKRRILWQSPTNKIIRIYFERFASMDNQHLLVQNVQIKALSDIDSCSIRFYIDFDRAKNMAFAQGGPKKVLHWVNQQAGIDQDDRLWLQFSTNQSPYDLILKQEVRVEDGEQYALASSTDNDSAIAIQILSDGNHNFALHNGQELTFTRVVGIATSRDTDDLQSFISAQMDQTHSKRYAELLGENKNIWDELWHDMDIIIEGDELAQLAIRFVTYHLLITAPRHDDRVSIGAKTLSGMGYKGHIFWDTELFMLPPFTLANPQIAKNLLMYRYHNLQGARNKAAEAGYRGAMFPWESTDTGEETTPRWTLPDENGNRVRIWTGDNEQHISSDIAYAVWQYWQWTGDDVFFVDYGAEIILDTTVFWESRVEWNEGSGLYELSQQIGPDEFHENIDNSVYTNALVIWHMEYALKTVAWLQANNPVKAELLLSELNIEQISLEQWQHIMNHMYLPRSDEHNVYEQFDGYFNHQYVDVAAYSPRVKNLDVVLGHNDTFASQVIKQADVVMMMAILGDRIGDRDEMLRNWDVYLPRTAHDSSLSPAIHSWVASRLGLVEDAYTLWMKSAGLDLENNKGNVRDGIHAAACGGLRQAIIFGFAGLRLSEDGREWFVDPQLPKWWKSIQFTIYHKGQRQKISVK